MLRAATYWPNLRFHSCKMRLDVPRYRICYTHESTPLVVVAIYDASPCFHAHPLPAVVVVVVVVVVAFTPKVHALLTHSTSTNHAFAYVASSSSSTRAVRARAPFLARRVLERSRSRSEHAIDRSRHRSMRALERKARRIDRDRASSVDGPERPERGQIAYSACVFPTTLGLRRSVGLDPLSRDWT